MRLLSVLPIIIFSSLFTACDWFTPSHTIVFTHNTNGYLEDCGCSGHKNGGLHRRMAIFATASVADRDAIYLDGGDVLSTYYRFPLRDKYVAEIMMMLQYDAIGVGEQDLINGLGFYDRWMAPLPMTSANLTNLGKSARVIKRKGEQVAIISLIDPQLLDILPDSTRSQLIVADPSTILAAVLAELEKKEIRNVILLSHLGLFQDKQMAEQFPQLSLIISAHDQDVRDSLWVVNETPIVQNGPDGERVGVLEGKFIDGKFRMDHFNRILLDSTIYGDSLVWAKINKYYAETDSVQPDLKPELMGNVSVENCGSCHKAITDQWLTSGHAHAFETLKNAGMEKDSDCLTCHTTHYGDVNYFRNTQETSGWVNVHCQQCHEVHVDPAAKRCTVTRERTTEKDCRTCHTPERSPAFDYKTYLLKAHG